MEQIDRPIAIVGFPQQGKSALKQELEAAQTDGYFRFVELPGVFMLGRNTRDEEEAYDFLLGRSLSSARPWGIIALVDSADLERQLYLVFQLIDLRLPLVLCLAGGAQARATGVQVDVRRLAAELGVRVFSLEEGMGETMGVLDSWRNEEMQNVKRQPNHWRPSRALADAYQHLDTNWIHRHLRLYTGARLVEGLRLLTVPKAVAEYEGHPAYKALLRHLDEARQILENRNEKWTMAEVVQRTRWIGQVVSASVSKAQPDAPAPQPKKQPKKWWQKFLLGVVLFFLWGSSTPALAAQVVPQTEPTDAIRPRAREAGVAPGVLSPGPLNAITDVAGVRVGHVTLIEGDDVRTGATAILTHGGNVYQDKVPAGVVVGNGYGKLMGTTQIIELGEIETPIVLTNTLSVPQGAEAILDWTLGQPGNESVRSVNAVVGETNDGYLNNIRKRALRASHIIEAIRAARGGPVEEGGVGAGTGTVSFGWKGGIGTSSRRLPASLEGYTVGVLVQTNYGGVLQIAGVPVGERLGQYYLKEALDNGDADGSIMVVVATDAPLSDRNLTRLARRALLGIARTGSPMTNGSGDYILSFSTAPSVRRTPARRRGVASYDELPNNRVSPLFEAVVEATEEAIYNAMFKAKTVAGHRGTIQALPLEQVLPLLGQ